MAHLLDKLVKKDCCGCFACASICPKQCISMVADNEGFLYPQIDDNKCVGCGMCENVCPVASRLTKGEPKLVFAAKNPDEDVRMQSSSGGVFSMIADWVITQGGVVFGACWNDKWEVVHDYTETNYGISKFRGSKYVQSRIGNSYKQAEQFLKKGRIVLFSGTPCQIAGLTKFLKKDYNNLFKVDIICHGVPSPLVFKKYIDEKIIQIQMEIKDKHNVYCMDGNKECVKIKEISFRDKRNGWKNFGFNMVVSYADGETKSYYEPKDKNLFIKGFLHNIYLRPSCYCCRFKSFRTCSDLTLGDYWGIDACFDDDKGTSVITINTDRGKHLCSAIKNVCLCESSCDDLVSKNVALFNSVEMPMARKIFFTDKNMSINNRISKSLKIPTLYKRILTRIAKIFL